MGDSNDTLDQYAVLAKQVLKGKRLNRQEAFMILHADDLMKVLNAALSIREHYFAKKVKLCVLHNAKSGACPEDCHYCSQSVFSQAQIEAYQLQTKEEIIKGAQHAHTIGAKRYCIVMSGRGPSKVEIDHLIEAVRSIKEQYPLEICCSLGFIDIEIAWRLKEAGVGWVNHNFNTSKHFHPEICTTHKYEDRIRTIQAIIAAGLSPCSGGIIGMGETEQDILDFIDAARDMGVEAIPINFLHAIEGTLLEGAGNVDPVWALKVLCLARFLIPDKEIRAAGGREHNLGDMQKWAIYPANSIFVDGYLTTGGQSCEDARKMIEEMGFEIER